MQEQSKIIAVVGMQQLSRREESFQESPTSQKNLMILNTLGDLYCRTILETVQEIPKPVVEITAETRIPISTVYRRIQTLHDLGFLKVSGSISKDGKKYFLYKSKVKSIQAKFDGKLEVEVKLVWF
jgi:predicted transcriptional regulator